MLSHHTSKVLARRSSWIRASSIILAVFFALTKSGQATTFTVDPFDLGSGFTLQGVIVTDGVKGVLTPADIVDWNLSVTSITEYRYNSGNTANLSIGVHSDGLHLFVPTSPDGVSDGGSMLFRSPNPFADFGVQVADFNVSSGPGGQAMYMAGTAFDFKPLQQPDGFDYVAGSIQDGSSSVFDLTPIMFDPDTVLSGTVTTDGTIGDAMITDWDVVVRATSRWLFTGNNSQVLSLFNLSSDGHSLTVSPFDADGNPGAFVIGTLPHFEPNQVVLADFTYVPDGEAGLVTAAVIQTISPLPLNGAGNRVVARAVPDGGSPLVFLGAASLVLVLFSRVRWSRG